MSNVLDVSFIHRSYPKLAYGSMYVCILLSTIKQSFTSLIIVSSSVISLVSKIKHELAKPPHRLVQHKM